MNNMSSKSIKSTKSLNNKSRLLTEISQATSQTYMQHNFQVVEFLDPVNLIDPNYLMAPMSQNVYDDYP